MPSRRSRVRSRDSVVCVKGVGQRLGLEVSHLPAGAPVAIASALGVGAGRLAGWARGRAAFTEGLALVLI